MYSTEEWKKDNGISDDDLITIYQASDDNPVSDGDDPPKGESANNEGIAYLNSIGANSGNIGNTLELTSEISFSLGNMRSSSMYNQGYL
jgi:hypothetical protein